MTIRRMTMGEDPVRWLAELLWRARDQGLCKTHSWPDGESCAGGPYVADVELESGTKYRLSISRLP